MLKTLLVISIITILLPLQVFAQDESHASELFQEANKYFIKGDYKNAIEVYDQILEIAPKNISTLKMKGIALSNLGQDENSVSYHTESLEQFYTIIQHNPYDTLALTGMGIGFGYLGEYEEAKKYFQMALEQESDSTVIKNYLEFVDNVTKKYPYTPTEKPIPETKPTAIPDWIRNNAGWWSEDMIADSDFVSGIQYLIKNNIMEIDPLQTTNHSAKTIPDWVRNNAGWWSDRQISDEDFLSGIYFLIQNGIISVNIEKKCRRVRERTQRGF